MFRGLKCSFFTTQPATACALCMDISCTATEVKRSRMSSSGPALQEAFAGPEVFHCILAGCKTKDHNC